MALLCNSEHRSNVRSNKLKEEACASAGRDEIKDRLNWSFFMRAAAWPDGRSSRTRGLLDLGAKFGYRSGPRPLSIAIMVGGVRDAGRAAAFQLC
jgi:hypothetical protein